MSSSAQNDARKRNDLKVSGIKRGCPLVSMMWAITSQTCQDTPLSSVAASQNELSKSTIKEIIGHLAEYVHVCM